MNRSSRRKRVQQREVEFSGAHREDVPELDLVLLARGALVLVGGPLHRRGDAPRDGEVGPRGAHLGRLDGRRVALVHRLRPRAGRGNGLQRAPDRHGVLVQRARRLSGHHRRGRDEPAHDLPGDGLGDDAAAGEVGLGDGDARVGDGARELAAADCMTAAGPPFCVCPSPSTSFSADCSIAESLGARPETSITSPYLIGRSACMASPPSGLRGWPWLMTGWVFVFRDWSWTEVVALSD